MISPFFTSSPGFFSQRVIVPSCIVSLSLGMLTSAITLSPSTARGELIDRLNQLPGPGQRGQFERFGVRQRHLYAGHTLDRSIEIIKCLLLQRRGNLGPDTIGRPVLLKDDAAARLFHGVDDCLSIKRAQRTQIDYLDAQPSLLLYAVRHVQ